MPRRRWLVGGLLAVSLVSSGCAQVRAQVAGAERDDSAVLQAHAPLLEVVEWAELDGLVSVLVRNNTDRVLTGAEAEITVRDEDGVAIGPPPSTVPEDGCCLSADVPPGAAYGLHVDAGADVEAAEVEVGFRNVSWSARGRVGDALVALEPALLSANEHGAVIGARARTVGGTVGSAVVQARLQDPQGRLVAVVSGTWTCFDPRIQRRVWMQAPEQAPAGTTIGSVVAFAQPTTDVQAPDEACGPPRWR